MILAVMVRQLPPHATDKQLRQLHREMRLALRPMREADHRPDSIEIDLPEDRARSDDQAVIVELCQMQGEGSFGSPGLDQRMLWNAYETIAQHVRRLLGVQHVTLSQTSVAGRCRMVEV